MSRCDHGDGEDDSATVTRLYGAPGSGKTTTLLDYAAQEADDYGTPYTDLLFMTFTRSTCEETSERLREVYPEPSKDDLDDSVRTLHGAALSACLTAEVMTLRDDETIDGEGEYLIRRTNPEHADYFKCFFDHEYPGLDYDPNGDDPVAQAGTDNPHLNDSPVGNQLLALYDYVQSANWDLDDHHHAPIDVDLPTHETCNVLAAWTRFKAQHDLIQDADYLKRTLDYGVSPNASVLIIDEFQDLSPLQYALYEQWRDDPSVERVYIAGDVHQAIYGFRGADPTRLRKTRADETVHSETSYRCPTAITDAAVPIVAPVPEHDVSRVEAHHDGGRFGHVTANDYDDLGRLTLNAVDEHGEVYLLARTNRQAGKLAWGLRNAGVPYIDLKPDGYLRRWRDPLPTLLAALRSLGRGDDLPIHVAETLLANTEPAAGRQRAVELARGGSLVALDTLDPLGGRDSTGGDDSADSGRENENESESDPSTIGGDALRDLYGVPPNVHPTRIVPHLALDGWKRSLLDGTLRSGATHDPEDVRVGTIHAAKGLEAPSVFVFPAYSQRQFNRYLDDGEAEERRLFYVAVTRASEECRIVHDYFGSEEFPPLARDR